MKITWGNIPVMKKLIEYLNAMPPHERQAFARQCGTTEGYMRKVASTGGFLNPVVCSAIERLTYRGVTRESLRPTDYWQIWPELANAKAEG